MTLAEMCIRDRKLPEGFQRSEFLLEHGFVDKIVERKDQKRVIGQILYMHRSHKMNIESKNPVETARTFVDKPSESQEDGGKTAWDTVLLSRKSDRPVATDYINALFDEFIEFHGDRYFKDDGAIVGLSLIHIWEYLCRRPYLWARAPWQLSWPWTLLPSKK